MEKLILSMQCFVRDEEGVTMVEYGLIAALIAVVAIIALSGVGTGVQTTFQTICNYVKNAVSGGFTC